MISGQYQQKYGNNGLSGSFSRNLSTVVCVPYLLQLSELSKIMAIQHEFEGMLNDFQ